MDKLSTTAGLVKEILETNPAARDSDNFLFYLVCKKLLANQGIDIDTMLFVSLFLSLSAYDLPQFETVGRVRRKLQQKFPEFRCSDKVALYRCMNEDSFTGFATEGVV